MTLNGYDRGVAHLWANVSWCPFAPGQVRTARLSNYGSWSNAWVGYAIPEITTRLENRCNIQVVKDGNTLTIGGVWLEGCPEVQFIPGGCPAGSLDCGSCCLPCDDLVSKIRALV